MSLTLGLAMTTAAVFADLDAIDRQVAAFTGAEIGASGGAVQPLDRRLRLNACMAPIALSWRTQAQSTVVVQCPDSGGWRLFVPVRASARPAMAAPAVNRGDAVSIVVSGGGFSVSRPGEALETGPVGAWIRVRPVTGRGLREEPLRARIERPGVVALPIR
ncbi:MAG: flagella basal body P-ring formation protein FlgA [Novosphingobium sp.]